MVFDNSLKVAFLISLACHSWLIIALPGIKLMYPKAEERPLEVTYYKISQRPQLSPSPRIKQPAKKAGEQQELPLPQEQRQAAPKQQEQIKEDTIRRTDRIIKIKEQKPLDMARIQQITAQAAKTPAYLDYGRAVHKRISDTANKRYGRFRYDGEVFVTFALFSDGTLAGIAIIDEKSTPDGRLKTAAAESIKSASPFDPFPEDLDFPQLSFNVVISFER